MGRIIIGAMVEKREPTLTNRHKKILAAVLQADEAGHLLSADGVVTLLQGNLPEAWASALSGNGALLSLSGRQGKTAVHWLVRHGYLHQTYSRDYDEYYLYLSNKGKEIAVAFSPKLKRKEKTAKPRRPYSLEKESL